jgi:hypothetical protein
MTGSATRVCRAAGADFAGLVTAVPGACARRSCDCGPSVWRQRDCLPAYKAHPAHGTAGGEGCSSALIRTPVAVYEVTKFGRIRRFPSSRLSAHCLTFPLRSRARKTAGIPEIVRGATKAPGGRPP